MENFEKNFKKESIKFEKIKKGEDALIYVFPHVGVAIDSSGKNYEPLPELLFGTYDENISEGSMDQPELKREGVDMSKIVEYIKTVSEDSGINEFWVYPYGEDGGDDKKQREAARMRLFSRFADLQPDENNFGYIIKI